LVELSKGLRAQRMQESLKQLGVGDEQPSAKVQRLTWKQLLHKIEQRQQLQQQEQQRQQQQEDMNSTHCIPVDEHTEDAAVVERNPSLYVLHMSVSFC